MTDATGPAAGWRRLAPGRALGLFIVLLLVTFAASRSCASTSQLLTKDEAVTIAQREVDYTPDGTNIRFLRRGVDQHPYWAVSLWQRGANGVGYDRVTVVVVDARGGKVTEVDRTRTTP